MLDLFERREPIDIVTVAEALERDEDLESIGGRAYLGTLSNATPTAVHATQYARIVERKAVLRNLIGAAGRIAGIGYEDPAEVQEAIDRAESELFAVSQRRVAAGFSLLRGLLHDAYDRLDYLHAHRGEISGIRTGFGDLDALTTGLQKSDLVILAARPSVGKTSFALNIAEHAAVHDKKSVGVFSLEMSKEQLVLRLLSSVANIDSQRLRTGLPRGARLRADRAGDERPLGGADLHRRHAQHHDDGAAHEGPAAPGGVGPRPRDRRLPPADAVVHHDPRRQPRPGGVGDLARAEGARARAQGPGRRALASSRASPRCASRREPRLSDLRESGSIEQDADLVMFLWREKDRGAEDQSAEGEVIKLKLSKHRNGPTGEIDLWFRKAQTRFVNYAGERFADVG